MGLRISPWLLALVLAVPGCRKSIDMATETPTGSIMPGAAPAIALGAGWVPAAFAPGYYATAIQRKLHGTHDLQVLNEDSTSVLSLHLLAGGAASACRGWRYEFRNDGPAVHSEYRYREQQGYRGHYVVVDGVAQVELTIDNAVCPHVFEGELALARAPGLKLRCVVASLGGKDPLPAPVLLCQPADLGPAELDPQVVAQLAPAGWFALGGGNGLRVWVSGRPQGARAGADLQVTVKVADAPLGANAWERAF